MAEIILRDYEDDYGYLNVIGEGNLSAAVIIPQIEAAYGQELIVNIASIGGSVFNGLAIYNALVKHGNVTTINEGYAMSIAALIAMAGKKRKTYSASMFMIHKAGAFIMGRMNADDMRKEAEALDVADDIMATVFSKSTGLSKEDMLSALSKETFYTGFDAEKLGFFTELADGETQPIVEASYKRITANQPLQMVALLDKTLKIKDNNMAVIDELKAQHEENKGFFAEIKALFTGKPAAQATPEPEEETKPEAEQAENEAGDPDLVAENAALKAENDTLKAEKAETAQALAEAKTMMAETKTLLGEVRSTYKPEAAAADFTNRGGQQEEKKGRFSHVNNK